MYPTAWQQLRLAAAGLGLDWESIQQGISDLFGIPGRMERIDLRSGFSGCCRFCPHAECAQSGYYLLEES